MKKWLENMRISKKLIIGFLVITFLGIIIGIIGISNLINIVTNQEQSYNQRTLGIEYSKDAEIYFTEVRVSVRNLYIYYDSDKTEYYDDISNKLSTIEELIEKYSGTLSDSQDQAFYSDLKETYVSFKEIINMVTEASKAGKSAPEILELIVSGRENAEAASEVLKKIGEYNVTKAAEGLESDKALAWRAIYIMIGVVAVSFIIALLLGLAISGLISKPMQKFAAFAEMLAVGDIAVEKVIEEKDRQWAFRKDEVGILASAFEKMIASTAEQSLKTAAIAEGDFTTVVTVRSEFDILGKALSELVDKFHALALSIVSSSEQVDAGAKQVADSSTALSQGAAEQASSVEELSASMEEITSQTAQNAQNAQKTNELAKNIQKDADVSNAQMAEMLRAMEEINASSDNISKIIKVIEDIAFQTNILALNAAVEAARAGQYGKGFAVVAEEVKNLAGQSSKAAKETTELIENSIKKVGAGTKIANETSAALSKIVDGVLQAGELVDSIATASNEQAAALEQINQGIMEISQVIQTNAASAEECAAASEELSSQADCLKQNVSVFKLNPGSAMSAKK